MDRVKTVEGLYRTGGWNKARVRLAVASEWISPEQYEQITGEPYGPEQEVTPEE